MKSESLRLIRLVCGILCMISGIVTIICGSNIKDTSFYVYNGVFCIALGAMFIGISILRRNKSGKTD